MAQVMKTDVFLSCSLLNLRILLQRVTLIQRCSCAGRKDQIVLLPAVFRQRLLLLDLFLLSSKRLECFLTHDDLAVTGCSFRNAEFAYLFAIPKDALQIRWM